MGKLTVIISDEVENMLRDYIRSKYRRPYGKLSEVVEESIRRYLEEQAREERRGK